MVLPGEALQTGAPETCPECDVKVEPQVCSSNAGFYIGTWCACGPYSRESGYYRTHEEAQSAFEAGLYGRL